MLEEVSRSDREQGAASAMQAGVFTTAPEHRDSLMTQQLLDALLVRGMNARREHRRRCDLAKRCGSGFGERVQPRTFERKYQARVRAELTDPERQRGHEVLAHLFGARCKRTGKQDDRVDAAHLGIYRDGLGPFVGDLEQCQTACARTGEADGFHIRMCDQALAQRARIAIEEREHALGQIAGFHGGRHCLRNEIARTGMCRMTLHDYGTACSQGRSGIAAGHREGEGEIAGAEDHHRAQRNLAQAQIGARQRLAIRQRWIDAQAHPAAFAQLIGEQTKLSDRTGALARQAGQRQSRLGLCAFEQLIAQRHDLVGSGLEEARAQLRIEVAIHMECFPRELAGLLDLFGTCGTEGRLQLLAGCWVAREKGLRLLDPARANE